MVKLVRNILFGIFRKRFINFGIEEEEGEGANRTVKFGPNAKTHLGSAYLHKKRDINCADVLRHTCLDIPHYYIKVSLEVVLLVAKMKQIGK